MLDKGGCDHHGDGSLASHIAHVLEHLGERVDPPSRSVVLRGPRTASGRVLDGPLVLHGGARAVPLIRCEHRGEAPGSSSASGSGASHQLSVVLTKSSSQIDGVTVVGSVRTIVHYVAEVGHRVRRGVFFANRFN